MCQESEYPYYDFRGDYYDFRGDFHCSLDALLQSESGQISFCLRKSAIVKLVSIFHKRGNSTSTSSAPN